MQSPKNERFFSIELNSKDQVKNICMTRDGQKDCVLIEGSIGDFVEASFTEGVIFEVVGARGTLRLDLHANELEKRSKA